MSHGDGKRAFFVIAHRGFRDEELLEPKSVLEAAGVRCAVASSALGPALGMLGARVQPDLLYTAIPSDADALVFVGGEGASEYWDDRTAHRLAREALTGGRVVGAICFGPSTLANARLLEGRNATAYASRKGHLVAQGARWSNDAVVRDGSLVTANGPEAARAFGEALLAALGVRT
jgi:protease I